MKPVLRRRPASKAVEVAVEPAQATATAPEKPKPVLRARPKNVSNEAAKARLEEVFIKKQETDAQITIRRYMEKIRNPRTAIRAMCVQCSGGMLKEVAECRASKCALYPFRMGENPFNKKTRERLMRDGVIPIHDASDETHDDDDEDGSVD